MRCCMFDLSLLFVRRFEFIIWKISECIFDIDFFDNNQCGGKFVSDIIIMDCVWGSVIDVVGSGIDGGCNIVFELKLGSWDVV